MNPYLSNEIVALRAVEPTDVDFLYKWENDAAVWRATATVAPFSKQLLWEYLKNYDADIYKTKELRLMIVERATGDTVGSIDLFNFDAMNSRVEVGVLVAEERQQCGIAGAAVQIAKRYAIEYLGVNQLYATVACDNEASKSLFASQGFQATATLSRWLRCEGEFCDAVVMQYLKK